MNSTHDVHLIYSNAERAAIKSIDEGLRARGLVPWFFEKDRSPDWLAAEEASIKGETPACAVFLGPGGWGQNYHLRFARLAYDNKRPIIPVLLAGWRREDQAAIPEIFTRRWVEFADSNDETALNNLAQRIVDAAYENPAGNAPATKAADKAGGRRLMVYVPARSQTVDSWSSLRTRLSKEPSLKDCAWYGHSYSGGIWSRESIEDLASTLEAAIAAAVSDADQENPAAPVRHITLMGHSFGGVLVRAAYLMAAGQYASAQQRSWWTLVDRIALFAAPNRGIEERRFAWKDKAALWWHGRAGQLTRDQLVGSPAITNLRIRWIRFFAQLDPAQRPVVVQFLGKGDEWVDRKDSLDIEQFPDAWQTDVPGATHLDVHHVSETGPDPRYTILRDGILHAQRGGEIRGQPERHRNPIVILLHGIRANNETWADQAHRAIEHRAPNALAPAPTYGYFPLLHFAIPWLRARKIRALQDQYSELLARHPRARFSFIGHSNATYMLGQSLKAVPGMCFDRVVLAASVLAPGYEWRERFSQRQVREVSNHRANNDMAVALGCNLLRSFGMTDVGTSGFGGFYNPHEWMKEVFYYDGDHSQPVAKDCVPKLVDYILTGSADFPLAQPTTEPKRAFLSRVTESTIVGIAVVAMMCGLLVGAIWLLSQLLSVVASVPTAWALAISVTIVLLSVYLFSRYY